MNPGGRDLIVFLGAGRLYFSDGDRVLAFEFPSGTVKDWDVLNKEVLQDSLNTFIIANKIEPSAMTFILSEPACFSKDLLVKDADKIDAEVAAFLDAVPFNYVVSKVYRIGNGVRVIAGNRDIIDTVAEAFETKGFPLYAVVPSVIFPKVGAKTELDMEFVKAVGSSGEIIQGGNMIAPKPLAPENQVANPVITNSKASSGYLPYLIGVGAIAVIILVALVLLRK